MRLKTISSFIPFIIISCSTLSVTSCNNKVHKALRIDPYRQIRITTNNKITEARVRTNAKPTPEFSLFYYWVADNKINITQGGYDGYILDGEYTEFSYPSNQLICKGEFTTGLKSGTWKTWHENGRIKYSEHWKKGVLDGDRNIYNPSGELLKSEHYNNGILYTPTVDTNKTKHTEPKYTISGIWHKTLKWLHIEKNKKQPKPVRNNAVKKK